MGEREELLAKIADLVQTAMRTGDLQPLLAPWVLRAAARVAELTDQPDVASAHVLGLMYWLRYQALPSGDDHDDFQAAAPLFTFCFVNNLPDEAFPAPLLPYLADNATPTAVEWTQQALASDNPELNAIIAQLWRRILAHTSNDNPDRAIRLNNLGNILVTRFERSGTIADLDEGIRVLRDAVAATPDDSPNRAVMLSNLGNALRIRSEQSGTLGDLNEAIRVLQDAAAATPDGNPNRAVMLSNLGISLRIRFEQSGAPRDLDDATTAGRDAVAATPGDSPNRAKHLSNLGLALRVRFGQTGALRDLDDAIAAGRDAVAATPGDNPNRADYMLNLGGALLARFMRSGALTDLEEAIRILGDAVAATPHDHPSRAIRLDNLGSALLTRFMRSGALTDLEEAIRILGDAVAATPHDHPSHAIRLNNLGNALLTKFERSEATAGLDDLEEAIRILGDAVAATPHDHPNRAKYLSNLGISLLIRFERSGTAADLEEAIAAIRDAVAATPHDHPNRADRLNDLGNALRARFERSRLMADREAAVTAWEEAAAMAVAAPLERVQAGRSAARLLATVDASRAAGLLEAAVRLLPEIAMRRLARSDQQHLIGELAGLAGEAAALALSDQGRPLAERAGQAARLLEAGRAVLLAQALETRTDLTDLRKHHFPLATRFTDLCALLDQPPIPGPDGTAPDPVRWAEDHRQAATELTALLEQIRALDGFASFASPPTLRDLQAQARQGAVVLINISSYRSDALLLTADGITSLPLELTPSEVIDQVNAFHQALAQASNLGRAAGRIAGQEQVRNILAWLWDTVTEPVLTALDHTRPLADTPARDEEWPRVWWAPGGLLGLLPLHAAGYHTAKDDPTYRARTVMDRVISSYTPTVGALRHARRPTPRRDRDSSLIVAMPHTPGLQKSDLPGAAAEAALLQARLPNPTLLVEASPDTATSGGQENVVDAQVPTRAAVFGRLPQVTMAHFACHGSTDPTDPSNSLLLLHDWQTNPCTVASLAPINLDHARLAYLSACSTATARNQTLLDEAIHLATAFQLAGFPHVIGTLWPISDHYATRIATAFYDHLGTSTSALFDTGRAAHALHYTIRHLRDDLPILPSIWAAHLHAGA